MVREILERLRFTFTANGKRQTQVEKIYQNRKYADKNSPERFLWLKLA